MDFVLFCLPKALGRSKQEPTIFFKKKNFNLFWEGELFTLHFHSSEQEVNIIEAVPCQRQQI